MATDPNDPTALGAPAEPPVDTHLRAALRHAPDHDAIPPAALSEAIRAAARAAVPAAAAAPPTPWWQRWWVASGRPHGPWGAALASLAVVAVTLGLWHGQEPPPPVAPREAAAPAAPAPTAPATGAEQAAAAPSAAPITVTVKPRAAPNVAPAEAAPRQKAAPTQAPAGMGAPAATPAPAPSPAPIPAAAPADVPAAPTDVPAVGAAPEARDRVSNPTLETAANAAEPKARAGALAARNAAAERAAGNKAPAALGAAAPPGPAFSARAPQSAPLHGLQQRLASPASLLQWRDGDDAAETAGPAAVAWLQALQAAAAGRWQAGPGPLNEAVSRRLRWLQDELPLAEALVGANGVRFVDNSNGSTWYVTLPAPVLETLRQR